MFHPRALSGEPAPALWPWGGRTGSEEASRPRAPQPRGEAAGGHALGRTTGGAELPAGRGAHDSGHDAGWRCRAAPRQTCCAEGASRQVRVKGRSALPPSPLSLAASPSGSLRPTLTRDSHPFACASLTAAVLGAPGGWE